MKVLDTSKFFWSSAIVLIILGLMTFFNRADFSNGIVISPSGVKNKISIPFDSQEEGATGIYSYHLTFRNSILFSGKLHLIPDDCIEEITINGTSLSRGEFPYGNCDCINGFFLDLEHLLKPGNNNFIFKIKNKQGFYGLKIIDTTFYEKYIIITYMLFLLCCLNYSVIYRLVLRKLHYYNLYGLGLVIPLFQLTALLITLSYPVHFGRSKIWMYILSCQLVLFIAVPAGYELYKEINSFKRLFAWVWVIVVLLFGVYVLGLSHHLFSYDYQGHIDYITYLVNYSEIPVSNGGWSFYHPSLYYRICAGFWTILNFTNQMMYTDFLKINQVLSLMIFILYCYWSIKTINLFFFSLSKSSSPESLKILEKVKLFSIILFLCWPSNSIVAVRIGNDILLNLLFAASFYFTIKWWYCNKSRYFFLALLLSSLSVWSKTNGFILFGIIGGLLGYNLFKTLTREPLHLMRPRWFYQLSLFSFFIILSFYYSFGDKLKHYTSDAQTPLVVGNAIGLGDNLKVKNSWHNFTNLNVIKFVEIPFTDSFDDGKGRTSFWFYLFKTALFGEFTYKQPLTILASMISFLFLLFLCLMVFGIVSSRKNLHHVLPAALSVFLMVSSMILFRVYYPYSSSNDFRYIYPAILPACLFSGRGLLFIRSNSAIYKATEGIIVSFIALSIIFQILTIVIYEQL